MLLEARILCAWIASIPGMSPRLFVRLQCIFPDFQELLSISKDSLVRAGVSERLASALVLHRSEYPPQGIAEYCTSAHIEILIQSDSRYPRLLKDIFDPPIVLYVKGVLPSDNLPRIAVIGTRHVTKYGASVTAMLTSELVAAGFIIVSGFMYGVDAIAHRTCMERGGKTIGVLGFGLDHMYPHTYTTLAAYMVESGNCLLSEFAPWVAPVPAHFPMRNRIVSGLCMGVVVTEAAVRSGSKITARLAVEQGRDVFAVPGSILSPYSEGTKELVNMGAKLVTSARDVVEELLT